MSKFKIEIKWAFTFIGVSLSWMLLERFAGLHDERISDHAVYTNFFAIPAVLIYVFALLEKRRIFYKGVMTYQQGLVTGLIITLIVTIFSPLTQYITSTVITPDFFANAIEYASASGAMTQAQAVEYFSLKNYILQGLIGAPVMGVITTLIIALFVRSRNAEKISGVKPA